MNRFDSFINKINFKKLAILYIIAALIAAIVCTCVIESIYHDRICFALTFSRLGEKIERGSATSDEIEADLSDLAASIPDVVDALVLDDSNRIVYSASDSRLAWDDRLELNAGEIGTTFMVSESAPNAVFKFVKKEEFMLSSVFASAFTELSEGRDEENIYQYELQNKTVYLLGFMGRDANGDRVYVINNISHAPGGNLAIKLTLTIAMFFFMLYWVITALWIYQNALAARLPALLWGCAALLTNLAAVAVYLIYKYTNAVCRSCGAVQNRENQFCVNCGEKIGFTCPNCGRTLYRNVNFCPDCGEKLNEPVE